MRNPNHLHPSQDEILRFLTGRMGPDRVELFYAHVDACMPCDERVRALQQLRSSFGESWAAFEAEARRGSGPSLEQVPGLRILLDPARRLAALADGVLAEWSGWGTVQARPMVAYTGVSARGPKVAAARRDVSSQLRQGSETEAIASLAALAGQNPEAAAESLTELTVEGRVVGRIVVNAPRGVILVLLFQAELQGRRAAAVLLDGQGAVLAEASLEPVSGADYDAAELSVPSGVAAYLALRLQP